MQTSKTNIEVINELEQSGALMSLIRAGLFPSKVLLYKEIYFYVDAKMKSGTCKTTAVTWASDQFGISDRQIFRILKGFEICHLTKI